jgi:hypothetical protein
MRQKSPRNLKFWLEIWMDFQEEEKEQTISLGQPTAENWVE